MTAPTTDIFCSIETSPLHEGILLQTKNFWVLYDGFPVTEPHILIIPKDHRDSYSKLPNDQYEEVENLIKKVSQAINVPYMVFEHGVAGQTVPHAHLHVMPIKKSVESIVQAMGVQGRIVVLTNLAAVATLTKYLLFCDNGTWFAIIPDEKEEVEPGIITNTVARLLGVPYPAGKRAPVTKEMIAKYTME